MDDDLGIAWLVKRVVVSRVLRGKPAPDVNDVDNALVEGTNAGRLVWGSMVPDIIGKIVGRGPLEQEIAETYSHRLGEDLDAVSSKALKEGYTASLSKGIDKSLSWARVAEAWGLDGAQMRAFIGSMKEDAYSSDIIPKRSAKQLEVMLNTRADRITENESYAIGQLAKQTHWIKMQQTGEIGPDVRKKWHTAADERVCPVCGPIDGQIVGLTATFGTGVFAPPVHPNCRCWTEIIESTVVTKRDYKRDSDGQFARQNTLMSFPSAHPFGRDTFGNPRPTQDDIQRMKKETAPLKGGKGGYDIVGGSTSGSMPFGTGISLVPTRDERYYQMHYRDWYDKKLDHNLFSPDEYYKRTWEMGIPYKQPKEDQIFSEQERAERAQTLKEIEGRWDENVSRANKEKRAPDMPSEEDLRNYWPWDEGWSGSQGKWEGKYREFHPSANRPPVNEHRMYKDLQQWQAEIDEETKTLPPYEGLRSDGKKITYTPLAREYDDENGLNPNNYPLRHVKPGDPAWEKFASDYATEEGMMTGFREDPHLPDLIDREDRARKGAELYRASQRTKTLSDVYNSGSERNSHRLPINPKKYQQKAKLRRLRSDIESRDASIREGLIEVNKSAVLTDREYNRDPDGQFATMNTLVPQLEHTGPSLPKQKYTPLPEKQLTQSQMRQIKAIASGKVITGFDEDEPVIELQKIASEIAMPYYRNTQMYYTQQEPHPDVTEKVTEVSQIIYDSKVRAGKTPKYKLKPKSVKMEVLDPIKPQTVEPETIMSTEMPLMQPVLSPVVVKSKVEVRGNAPDELIFVVLPESAREKIEQGQTVDFSSLPPMKAFDPRMASLEELNLEDTTQVLIVSGATWHPSKDRDGTGVLTGSYNVADYRYIQEDNSYVITARHGIEAFVLVPSSRVKSKEETQIDPDIADEGRKRDAPKEDTGARDEYGREEREPWRGTVLGGKSGRDYKVETDEVKWRKEQGLSREAVDVPGYVNFSSNATPFKKDNILKRMPSPRKVT